MQYKNDNSIQLTHREAHLLFHLIKNKNEVLDRSLILSPSAWGRASSSRRRAAAGLTKLRKKLNQDENIQIVNVRGFGYKLIC